MSLTPTRAATVAAALIVDDPDGVAATLEAVAAQVYAPHHTLVVGDASAAGSTTGEVATTGSLDEALALLGTDVEYLWVLRSGAIPAPDALSALVADAERTDAGIIGSKIIGGDRTELMAVGLITDVFATPWTGLDRAERDQGQYDVVREVAAVAGVSMLVRRDLLHGLGGPDTTMTPLAAAIDLANRARLRGAGVVITPSSNVGYGGSLEDAPRWRAEASRIRTELKSYGPVTLAWVLPLDFLSGLLEWVVSIFLGRWYGFDWALSWGWNVVRFPSTLSARRRARHGRYASDADLFRFQRRGSVKMARLGGSLLSALQRRLPGDDRVSMDTIGRDVRRPAFVVGVLALVFVLVSARNLWSDGLPAVGYTLPFPSSGWDALAAYAGGWNPSGLGSTEVLRPLIAVAAIARIVTLHTAALAEYLVAAGAVLSGIWGMTRLLRTWSIPATPALIAGVVYVAGPTANGIAGNTHIGSLIALGLLPWAVRLSLAPVRAGWRAGLRRLAAAAAVFGLLGALSPLMLVVPLAAVASYALFRFTSGDAWRGLVIAMVGTATGFLLLSPWIWNVGLLGLARRGYAFWDPGPVILVAAGLVVVASVVGAGKALGIVAGWAATMTGAGYLLARSGSFGWGTETESVALAAAGLGIAVAVAIVSHSLAEHGLGRSRRVAAGFGSIGVVVLVVAATTIVLGGRLGLPGDQYRETLRFTSARQGEAERSRVLLLGPASLMPGDSRSLGGASYKVVSATGPDLGEARLASPTPFDDHLADHLQLVVDGDSRRAGGELAVFGIKWIVIMGDSEGADADPVSLAWREVFAGQLDLIPISAGTAETVFLSSVDPVGRALTSRGDSWARDGWTYRGDPAAGARVFITESANERWGPPPRITTEFHNEIAADDGVASFTADVTGRRQAIAAGVGFILLIALGVLGRRRS